MATLIDWLELCATTPEFVDNYNRLRGAKVSFVLPTASRSPIAMMVDEACGYMPTPINDPAEIKAFFDHCVEISPWACGFATPTPTAAGG